MATKKDLVEAHAFSRRRLVTAFVSGAPGGREVEPVRPGRVLIGGVALSVLLLAGAAIAGFLLGRPPAQWLDEGSFVISKDTGEQYVVRPELIGLAPAPDGAGEVVAREFRGHDVVYRVVFADGTSLWSQRPSNELVPLGSRVHVSVHDGPVPVF